MTRTPWADFFLQNPAHTRAGRLRLDQPDPGPFIFRSTSGEITVCNTTDERDAFLWSILYGDGRRMMVRSFTTSFNVR